LKAVHSRAGAWLSRYRIDESDSKLLGSAKPPRFVFIHAKRSDLSSTELRNKRAASLATVEA
jgi:nicotinate-nucleotide adenylyltransferase